ncbi:hypothetical protein HOLleu_34538 [Holothuria leucospilota]|uniref:Uncharacterized protein n=1 Tax=Holothuria leucospilota TaxID=206669 RepID=A0A9Q0YL75_HOLLE|nr:hypothetical protein HOLleu_34538 [Holothuria leucospilota]
MTYHGTSEPMLSSSSSNKASHRMKPASVPVPGSADRLSGSVGVEGAVLPKVMNIDSDDVFQHRSPVAIATTPSKLEQLESVKKQPSGSNIRKLSSFSGRKGSTKESQQQNGPKLSLSASWQTEAFHSQDKGSTQTTEL